MKNTKGNILYIGGFELPDLNAAAHRVLANGKIFRSLGYDLIYVGVSHDKTCNSDIFETKAIADYGTNYKVKYPNSKIEWFKYLGNISKIIKIIELNNIKTVIAYNYPALALYRLFRYCKGNNIKLISDCTEWEISQGGILFRIIKGLDSYFRMRIIHPRLNGIITISRFLNDFYLKKNKNLILVPPLVDLDDSKWSIEFEDNTNSQIRRIIYAGRPGPNKDHLGQIIAALSIIRNTCEYDIRFEIMGVTLDDYKLYWKNYPIPENVRDNIFFHGYVSNRDVIKNIKGADFTIFVREHNLKNLAGFPTKFVESISCGTPVLTNNYSDISEYLQEGVNGFYLEISTLDELAVSLDRALGSSRAKINLMKDSCRSVYSFNYKKYFCEFENFINKIGL